MNSVHVSILLLAVVIAQFVIVRGFVQYNLKCLFILCLFSFSIFIVIGGIFAFVDLNKRPHWWYARKIQKDTCTSRSEYAQVARRSLTNLLLIVFPTLFILTYAVKWRRDAFGSVVPKTYELYITTFVALLAICIVIADFAAWSIHRALHTVPYLWTLHSMHHKHIAPIAISCIDAHPFEIVVWDMMPFWIGPFLLGVHPAFFFVFVSWAIINTLLSHCGYVIDGYANEHHDLHHERLKCNYSAFLSDWTMGTLLTRSVDATYPRFDEMQKDVPPSSRNEWCDIMRS